MKLHISKSITKEEPYKIVFVCLGNICRSPTAEGVFQHLVNEGSLQSYFEIDSAGTSAYHIGEGANSKSQKVANRHGVELRSKARKFETFDLEYYDLILAMDDENFANINQLDSKNRFEGKIMRLRDFDPSPEDGQVPDPYHGGMNGFENVFDVVKRSCEHLLSELKAHIDQP